MRTKAVILSAVVALCALVLPSLLSATDGAAEAADTIEAPAVVQAPAAGPAVLVSFTPEPVVTGTRGTRTAPVAVEAAPVAPEAAAEIAPAASIDAPVTIVPAAVPAAAPAVEAPAAPAEAAPVEEAAAPAGPDHSLFLPAPISGMTSGDAAAPIAAVADSGAMFPAGIDVDPSTDMVELLVSGSGAMFPAELGTDIDFSTDMVGLTIDAPAAG